MAEIQKRLVIKCNVGYPCKSGVICERSLESFDDVGFRTIETCFLDVISIISLQIAAVETVTIFRMVLRLINLKATII